MGQQIGSDGVRGWARACERASRGLRWPRGRAPRLARWRQPVLLVVALALLTALVAPPDLARGAPTSQVPPDAFRETFTGRPAAPTPWHGAGWDVTVHSRNRDTWDQLEPIAAHHGADCAAPPATHLATEYADAVFHCND